ncbi:MAG: hypothetical protein V3V34_11760 [Kiloniellales bacterium]
MSEHGGARQEAEDSRIASVDQTDTVDLSSGIKDDGYPPSSIPAAQEHNWLFWKKYLEFLNLRAGVPRIFDSLGEALDLIGASSPLVPIVLGERFAVDGLLAGGSTIRKLGDPGLSTATGANPVLDVACDGQRVFHAVGSNVQAIPNLGSAVSIWNASPGSPNFLNALESDNLNVYAAYATSHDVYVLDPTDGSTNAIIADATGNISDIAANGVHLLVAEQPAFLATVYDTLGGTPAFVGNTPSHGADVLAVALDHDQGYLVGDASASLSVRAFALATPGSFLWSAELKGITSAVDVKADGAFVYVISDLGDGSAAAWCLRRSDGKIVWRATVGSGAVAMSRCAVDHRHLWVSDVNDEAFALDKGSGAEVFRTPVAATFRVACADGHQVIGHIPGGSNFITGLRVGEHRVFSVVGGTDPDRHPFPRISKPEAEPPLGARDDFGVFGNEYQLEEETTADTTSGSTPVQYLRLTTPASLPAGTYHVAWFYVWQHNNTGTDFAARVQVDDTTDLIDPAGTGIHRQEPKDVMTTQRQPVSGFAEVVLTAGAHDIDLDFWSATATGTAQLFHARLMLYRVN